MEVRFTLNGEDVSVAVQPGETLLEVLRKKLHMTGSKQGCAVGECGACTAIIEGEPIDACLYLAAWADGKQVRTIEGESVEGTLSPMQQSFVEHGAVQCGFCIPGFIMSATHLLEASESLGREEIRVGLSGNLCRCTGYTNIIRSVEAVVKAQEAQSTATT